MGAFEVIFCTILNNNFVVSVFEWPGHFLKSIYVNIDTKYGNHKN